MVMVGGCGVNNDDDCNGGNKFELRIMMIVTTMMVVIKVGCVTLMRMV